jgi:transcriptional regulator with XRE-family HTH domain
MQAGLRARDVSEALGWSPSKLSRIETSTSSVKPEDLDRLLDFYQAPDDVRNNIGALVHQPVRRTRRQSAAVPDVLERYTRFEEQASQIQIFAAAMVPGLLQTQEYAAVIVTTTPTPEDHLAMARMQTRMSRQAVLGRIPPPEIRVIIDESVLMRRVGGEAVMRRQMLRLRELSGRPEMTIRILPLRVGAHPALPGAFTILTFPEDLGIPPYVFHDDLVGGLLRSKADEVERYRAAFALLEEAALSGEESAQMFAARAADDSGMMAKGISEE